MGECTTDLRTPTLLTSDASLTGVQGGVVLDCREPVDYELFMRGVWQLIVQQTNIYGKQMDIRWENTNIEGMKQFLALCMQMARAKFLRLKDSGAQIQLSINPIWGHLSCQGTDFFSLCDACISPTMRGETDETDFTHC
ncbi:hypothetical protein KIN20_015159 [Parelaphostrongylus tenuis]|uniref:Uncharacterized protein n=1 Tax=Parelaphostrongylus tenuis TaxID=148309 RepID=A0AAD5N0C1_PARTN|nr:hypothetical protein KIN20_015159 [Parelaphostrongylus tenuis]